MEALNGGVCVCLYVCDNVVVAAWLAFSISFLCKLISEAAFEKELVGFPQIAMHYLHCRSLSWANPPLPRIRRRQFECWFRSNMLVGIYGEIAWSVFGAYILISSRRDVYQYF